MALSSTTRVIQLPPTNTFLTSTKPDPTLTPDKLAIIVAAMQQCCVDGKITFPKPTKIQCTVDTIDANSGGADVGEIMETVMLCMNSVDDGGLESLSHGVSVSKKWSTSTSAAHSRKMPRFRD